MSLVRASLRYYWRTGLMVACGVAVATMVVVGALVVGDSVRGSVRDRALARLGRIENALVTQSYLRASLASRNDAALILTTGVAQNADTEATLPNVSVVGCDSAITQLYGASLDLQGGDVAVNETVASELRVREGDALVLTVGRASAIPMDSLFARRKNAKRTLRATIRRIVPDAGIGGFGLDAGTLPRRNVFVSREWLAAAIGKPGRANAIVTAGRSPVLASAPRPEDVGLRLVTSSRGYVSVESEAMALTEQQVAAAMRGAHELGLGALAESVYLAMTVRAPGKSISYAMVAGAPGLHGDELVLNRWASEDLGVGQGDAVSLEYLAPAPDGTARTEMARFTLRSVADMSSADSGLVPTLEGMTNAKRVSDWDPPFPVDLSRETQRDEDYWARYRAAPKVFVGMEAVRAMWRGPDWITSVRVFGPSRAAVERALMHELPAPRFQPVRKLALAASHGSSDFAGLLLGMGAFLVVAGLGLAASQMRLMVERRSFQVGLMLATGSSPSGAARPLFAEGLILSAVGAAAGGGLGVQYARLMLLGLATWWSGAVGGFPVWLHADPASVVGGALGGFMVGALAVWWGLRGTTRAPVLNLLSGKTQVASGPRRRWMGWASAVLVAAGAGLAVAGTMGMIPAQEAFFGVGACLLAAGILGADVLLRRRKGGVPSLVMLARRNASANRRHSLSVLGLLACASFILVTVAASDRQYGQADVTDKSSGTGGFALVATSSLPLGYDFGTPRGREQLGFEPEDEGAFRGVRVFGLLATNGENASCLNLAQPKSPRVLGAPKALLERGGFTIQPPSSNPWNRLTPAGDPIPAFADADTATWILHTGVGQTFSLPYGPRLRFAGLLQGSIFASDLLISEDNFRRAFPGNTAPRYFLIETPLGREDAVAQVLRRVLGPQGLDVRTSHAMLNAIAGVQNAYLSTFLALGGLGLLLGTAGLATALIRGAIERRKELALLLAVGLRQGDLARIMLYEHLAVLAAGIVLGALSALVAVAPHLLSSQVSVNWAALGGSLAAIVIVGLASTAIAAAYAVRGNLLAALRSE